MTHPSYKTLVDYTENKLNDPQRTPVVEHLAGCPQCQEKLTQLHTVLEAMTTDQTVAPPAEVLSAALALHQKQFKRPPHPILRVLAALQFDSRRQLSALASRGSARARQMLYSAQQVDVDLKITPENNNYDLVGQILSVEQSNPGGTAFVSLQKKTGLPLMVTETDALGQFTLRQIPAGVYDLFFDLGDQEVAITSLEFIND